MKRERIDKIMVELGLADSRTRAQALIMSGLVLVNDRRIEKSSEKVEISATIRLKGSSLDLKYVGRGGLKLEAALKHFQVDPSGWKCIDIGASTGGFTDCLLQHGAAKVVAVDAGTNQLVWSLRTDPRVEVHEKTNARELDPDLVGKDFDLAVMDVSFISVKKVIPSIVPLLTVSGKLIVLIKPQFEVGKGEVGKGGIVRDPEKHIRVVADVNEFVTNLGLSYEGVIDSPILGAEGNKEFLAFYAR